MPVTLCQVFVCPPPVSLALQRKDAGFKFYVNCLRCFKHSNSLEALHLDKHAAFTDDESAANVVLHKVNTTGELQQLSNRLLQTPTAKPQFIYFRVNLDRSKDLLELPIFKRANTFFINFDLRDHVLTDDMIPALNGFTIPPPFKFPVNRIRSKPDKNYLISFKGSCDNVGWFGCCEIRKHMKTIFALPSKHSVLFQDTADKGVSNDENVYYELLSTSTFGLVLHGHGRWSFRLIEVMGSGAIPVVVADGLTLPFEDLIDYDHALIRVSEAQAFACTSADDFVALLPTDIASYKGKARKIYDEHFASEAIILDNIVTCMKLRA